MLISGACLSASLVFAVSLAWACVGVDFGTPPTVALQPGYGVAGGSTTVTGKSFATRPVEIRWDSIGGPLLASAIGPNFVTPVSIPAAPSGAHAIYAFSRTNGIPDAGPNALFQVTPTPAAVVGPAPSGPANPAAPVPPPALQPAPATVAAGQRGSAPPKPKKTKKHKARKCTHTKPCKHKKHTKHTKR